MSGFEHRLLNVEVIPPPEVWENIAGRLDREFDIAEQQLSEKLLDTEVPPPAAAWNNIITAIRESQPVAVPAPVRNFNARRIAVAAILLGIVVASALYFFNFSEDKKQGIVVTPAQVEKPDNPQPERPPVVNPRLAVVPPVAVPKKTRRSNYGSTQANRAEVSSYPEMNTRYANAAPLLIANNNDPAKVSAPLLRDASGRIIFDRDLLASPGDNYVTITGPNGEQTRISTKFLSVLTDLNNESAQSEYFDFIFGRNTWKSRFDEWRNKMIQSAAFAPSATNFFDIVELKDLLENE